MTQQPYQYAHDNPLDETDPTGLGCGIFSPQDCVKDAGSAIGSAASAVGSGVSSAASWTYNNVVQPVGSGIATGAEWTWNHKEQVGLIAGGVVLVVGGTVLTGGLLDAAALAAGAAEEEGVGAVAWETYSMATHGIFVFGPGITLIGGGLTAIGGGIYQLLNGHGGHSTPEAC